MRLLLLPLLALASLMASGCSSTGASTDNFCLEPNETQDGAILFKIPFEQPPPTALPRQGKPAGRTYRGR